MAGKAVQDDRTIRDEDLLWRRVPPWHFFFDDNLGRDRPSSAAFDDDPDGHPMSVILASETAGPESVLEGHEGFALAGLTVREVRSCGLGVIRDPLPKEPAHALVVGRKTKSVRSRLARAASWVVSPPSSS